MTMPTQKATIEIIMTKLTGVCVSIKPVKPAARRPSITAEEYCAATESGVACRSEDPTQAFATSKESTSP
jgi:hypothetical protein